MIYLDSSALLKLIFEEEESASLEAWLTARAGTPLLSSELAKVEVVRACRRIDEQALPVARVLLAQLDYVRVTSDVVDVACELDGALLRSLDAIHVASALVLGSDLTAVVAYDRRLAAAVTDQGLAVAAPA